MRQAFGAQSVAGARPFRRNGQFLAYGSHECPDFADAVADHPEAEQVAGVVAGSRGLRFFDERPRSVEQAMTGGPGVEPCTRDHRGDGIDESFGETCVVGVPVAEAPSSGLLRRDLRHGLRSRHHTASCTEGIRNFV